MFKKHVKVCRVQAAVLAAAMALANVGTCFPAQAAGNGKSAYVAAFENPAKETQSKIRYWLKGAYVERDKLFADMKAIAEAGFSGVEVINKGGSSHDLATYGWGSPEWQKTSELLIEATKRYGLSLDVTIGPTWPAALPTLDKDDPAASQQLVWSIKELADSDFNNAVYSGGVPAAPVSENGTAQHLVSVVAAKLTGTDHETDETLYTVPNGRKWDIKFTVKELDEDSLQIVTPKDEGGSIEFSLKAGERAADYVLFAFYSQGTGQTVSGSTDPAAVCIDHYSEAGTQKLLTYWEENILNDSISAYFKEHGGDLFEDSLELASNVVPWTPDILDTFRSERGYDMEKYLPVLIERYTTLGFNAPAGGQHEAPRYGFADRADERIANDYNELLDTLYQEKHLQVIDDWAKEQGLTYRVQAYSGYDTGHYDSIQAASMVGKIEGESLAFMECHDSMDSFRYLAGGAHMGGKQIVSDELGAVFFGTYNVTAESLGDIVNKNAAGGANAFVLHGYPSSCEVGGNDKWPGYHPFGSMFAEPWDSRQPVWEDEDILTDFMARTEQVLQSGQAKMDVVIFRDYNKVKMAYFDSDALDRNGYSYEYVSPDVLQHENAVVTGGRLSEKSAAYKAMIVYKQKAMSTRTVEKLTEYSRAGFPIVFVGGTPEDVTYNSDSKAAMTEKLEALLGQDTVYRVETPEELPALLKRIGVEPSAQYSSESTVHTLHRQEGAVDYYWMYNDGEEAQQLEMTLEGQGRPYRMDLWTGEVQAVANYTVDSGRVAVPVKLEPGDVQVIAVTEETFAPSGEVYVVEGNADSYTYNGQGQIVARTEVPGTVEAVFSNGGTAEKTAAIENTSRSLKNQNWSLDVESWTADPGDASPTDASRTRKSSVYKELTALADWTQIQGLETVSGKAVYKTTFDVAKLADGESAYLKLTAEAGNAAVTRILLNGRDAGAVDQIGDFVDLKGLLKTGKNTLEIHLATTLSNAVNSNSRAMYGISDAQLIPYGEVILGSGSSREKELETLEQEAKEAKAAAEAAREEAQKAQKAAEEKQRAAEEAAKKTEADAAAVAQAQKEAQQAMQAAAQKEAAAQQAELEAKKAIQKANDTVAAEKFKAQKVTVKSVKSAKKKQVSISWKKVSGAAGYVIQYANKSSMKGAKTVKIKGNKTFSKTVKNAKLIKSRKKVYLRVKAYKTIGGKTVYTSYSAKKSVKVK